MATSDAVGLRDRIRELSPSWLQGGIAGRLMYGYGLAFDALLQKLYLGQLAHFPTRAEPDALTVIGEDRLIRQGLTELPASYAERLQHAFETWQLAGSARSVLSQLLGYLLALHPAVEAVASRYNPATYPPTRLSSTWDVYPVGRSLEAEPVHSFVDAAGGKREWDSLSQVDGSWGFWGEWILAFSVAPNVFCSPAPFTFGTPGIKIGATGTAIGIDKPASLALGMVAIVEQLQGGEAWARSLIVSFDASLFDPAQPAGGGVNPDGKFGRWSKIVGGQYVPSRFANARYSGPLA